MMMISSAHCEWSDDLNVKAPQKQGVLFSAQLALFRTRLSALKPVAYNVLSRSRHALFVPFTRPCNPFYMPLLSGTFSTTSLTEILRPLIETRQTGYLKMKEGNQEGQIAIENGIILHSRAGASTGLHALFQFVGWREATFEFHERPMPADLPRDLAVYDSQLLITGIAFKVDELNLLQQAIPPPDAVPCFMSSEGLASVEVTPFDLGMLALADGQRTVREIAQKVNLSVLEVGRNLARFRLAGVLDLVPSPFPTKPALAATA
jgi:hypothetical protein